MDVRKMRQVGQISGAALAVVLISIGSKIFIADLLGIVKFPPAVSLSITFAILAFGVVYSLWKMRG